MSVGIIVFVGKSTLFYPNLSLALLIMWIQHHNTIIMLVMIFPARNTLPRAHTASLVLSRQDGDLKLISRSEIAET